MMILPLRQKLAAVALAIAGAAIVTVLLAGGSAHSQTMSGQRATAADLRAAVRAESRRIAATAEGLAAAEARLAELDARVQRRREQATSAQDRLITARVRLTRLERNAENYRRTLATNLVAAYKTPTPDLLGVAVRAEGFDDLLSQLRFLNDIADRNATILRDTRRARKAVQGQAAALKKLRLRLIELARQASEDRDRADILRNALLRRQADQLRRRDGAQARLSTVRARIARLEREQAANALRDSGSQGATEHAPPAPPAAPAPQTGAPAAQGGDVVARVVAAANEIATTPYVWGGGHGGNSGGYDCSGSLSYALAAAGLVSGSLDSTGFMSWGEAGPGQRITVYANAGHAFMVVDGRRYDTSALRGGGTRWSSSMRSTAGFVARHPPGL